MSSITKEQFEKLIALRAQGVTIRQIAAELGISKNTVSNRLKTVAVKKGQKCSYNIKSAVEKAQVSAASVFRKMSQEKATYLARTIIDEALKKEPWALKLVFERLVPIPRTAPVCLKLEKGNNMTSIGRNIDHLLEKLAGGEVSGDEIRAFLDIFEAQAKAIEREKILPELEKLQAAVGLQD